MIAVFATCTSDLIASALEEPRHVEFVRRVHSEPTRCPLTNTIVKTKPLERLHGKINARQEKALLRMLQEGLEGFKSGLNARDYMKIMGHLRLQPSSKRGAHVRSGELKHARYAFKLPEA